MTIAVLKTLCGEIAWCDQKLLEATLELALEIAREGREGRIGTCSLEEQRRDVEVLALDRVGHEG